MTRRCEVSTVTVHPLLRMLALSASSCSASEDHLVFRLLPLNFALASPMPLHLALITLVSQLMRCGRWLPAFYQHLNRLSQPAPPSPNATSISQHPVPATPTQRKNWVKCVLPLAFVSQLCSLLCLSLLFTYDP
jgi:hypothetical protein